MHWNSKERYHPISGRSDQHLIYLLRGFTNGSNRDSSFSSISSQVIAALALFCILPYLKLFGQFDYFLVWMSS